MREHSRITPLMPARLLSFATFCFAQQVKKRMEEVAANADLQLPSVTVEVTFVDTAPVEDYEFKYQKSYREVPDNLDMRMVDYKRVLDLLSEWSDINFKIVYQSKFLGADGEGWM